MSLSRSIWIYVIIIAVVGALISSSLLRNRPTIASQKEHFEEVTMNPIDKTYLSSMYQLTGIDRCDALYADIASRSDMREEMTERATEVMDNYILGFRMREWMPSSKDQQNALNKQNKYCYVMFDSNNAALDPIMEGSTCDMNNPMFQGVEFINSVRADSNMDVTHTLPYMKCVVDINPAKVNSSSLNYFWSRMGEAQCTNYQNKTQNEVNGLMRTLTACNNELKSFRNLDVSYNKCMNQQQQLRTELNDHNRMYTLSNCAFAGGCDEATAQGSLVSMKTRLETLQQQIRESRAKVGNLDRAIAEIQLKTRSDERRLNELNSAYSGLSNDLIRCETTDLPQLKTQQMELQDEAKRLTNTSNLLAQQYKECMRFKTAKQQVYDDLVSRTNTAETLYNGSNNQLLTCLSTSDYLRQTISTLKDQVQKFATQCNECTSTMVIRTAERDSLEADVRNLTRERDEWLKRCTYDQKKMLDMSVQTINQLRTSATQYTRQNCGNDMAEATAVNDLIQRKFQAIAQTSAPVNCAAQQDARAQCCAKLGLE